MDLSGHTKFFFGMVCLLIYSCVRQVSPPIRNVPPELVVEGLITTDSTPYSVYLSYSGPYTNTYEASQDSNKYFITDAKVTIEDNLGDSTICSWVGLGTYQSTDPSFVGTVGRTYTLKVYLSNGQIYLSKPETITPVPPIDSLTVTYDSSDITGIIPPPLIASVHTRDPGGSSNFYRWTSSGYMPRKSVGDTCNPFQPFPCQNPFGECCGANCEQFNPNNQLSVLSNQFIQGREIIQPVYFSPVYWFGEHFMQVNQYSISLIAYQFWQQYVAQTTRTGSILDPLPAPLTGNIYNQADSTQIALGLFSASDVTTKKVVVTPFFLQQYLLVSIAGQFVEPGDCQYTYPNTLPDGADPAGWENAQFINMH
jgi:hypothetical protein